jgi:hypothetical protein
MPSTPKYRPDTSMADPATVWLVNAILPGNARKPATTAASLCFSSSRNVRQLKM